ncbi:MAG: SDR family oxidoreductase [Krumholzibacteria bacterium]|nr:SDR family oxidoreductase [Candidatus Krumholzibacteria bacterium]
MVIDRFVDPPAGGRFPPGFLQGRCALVTGGARRIGRALVEALAGAGAVVVIHYRTSEDDARAVVAAVESAGGEAYTLHADLASSDVGLQLVDEAAQLAGQPIDILVNNASVFEPLDMMTTTVADWDRNIAVNLRAPFLLARGLARQLPRGKVGDVVNLNDDRALRPPADHFPYTISKVGLHGLTRSLAMALAPRVRVNELALGAVLPPAKASDDYLHALKEDIPLGRFGSPAEVAHALLFLLGNPGVTGQTILLNGGRHLA